METPDRSTLLEWMSLDLDGELGAEEKRALDAAIRRDAELAAEHRGLARMESMLESATVPVRAGFRGEVLASLPAAPWAAKSPRQWRLAAVLLVLLGGSSAALVGAGSAQLGSGLSFLGALTAVMDLFGKALLTGGGMLAASWKGVGLALSGLLAESTAGLWVFGFLVLCLNLLFFTMWKSGTRAVAGAAASSASAPRPGSRSDR